MKNLLLTLSLLGAWTINAQTFTTNPGTGIPDNNSTGVDIPLTVSGVGNIDCNFGLNRVVIRITHSRTSHLDIYLIDPLGTVYELSTDNGGNNANYITTRFDMSSANPITAGAAPFNGTYLPEGDFSAANNGQSADGIWYLRVIDDQNNRVGTVDRFRLIFAAGAEPDCPPAAVKEDCNGGTTICGDASFSGNSSGPGNNTTEIDASNQGCLSGENESSWYYFEADNGGTLELTIRTMVDYDFAIWGPYTGTLSCPPVGAPLRCSYASGGVNTGLAAGSGDTSENSGGDNFVDPIIATSGDKYIMLIDNFSTDGSTFTLDWTLSGGATLDCAPLPVTFSDFSITATSTSNLIAWKTYSESNNSHFLIQKMDVDGSYYTVETIYGQGNSSEIITYVFEDFRPENIVNYYRVVQVDFDGEETVFPPKSVDNRASSKEIDKRFNLLGQEVNEGFKGIVIVHYTDGTRDKIYQNGY